MPAALPIESLSIQSGRRSRFMACKHRLLTADPARLLRCFLRPRRSAPAPSRPSAAADEVGSRPATASRITARCAPTTALPLHRMPRSTSGPGWAALSLPEQGLSALPGLCGPVRPRQSTQAAPHPLCWMGSMVWAASRGRRRPVRRAGACSGVTAGPAQPSRAALRISGCRSGRLTGTSIGCLG